MSGRTTRPERSADPTRRASGWGHGASPAARPPGLSPGPRLCGPVSRRVCLFGSPERMTTPTYELLSGAFTDRCTRGRRPKGPMPLLCLDLVGAGVRWWCYTGMAGRWEMCHPGPDEEPNVRWSMRPCHGFAVTGQGCPARPGDPGGHPRHDADPGRGHYPLEHTTIGEGDRLVRVHAILFAALEVGTGM